MNRKTTHIRVHRDTVDEIKLKFPRMRMADFFDVAIKTNTALQVEAMLRGKKKNVRKKK
jgi:hypothetical protein